MLIIVTEQTFGAVDWTEVRSTAHARKGKGFWGVKGRGGGGNAPHALHPMQTWTANSAVVPLAWARLVTYPISLEYLISLFYTLRGQNLNSPDKIFLPLHDRTFINIFRNSSNSVVSRKQDLSSSSLMFFCQSKMLR